MLISKYVTVRLIGKIVPYYKKLGYSGDRGAYISIPIEDLSKGSHIKIDVECDYCKKVIQKEYKALLQERKKSVTKKDCCLECSPLKDVETNLLLYGVKNVFQLKEVSNKMKQTLLEKYGVEYISQSKEWKEKIIETNKNFSNEKKQSIIDKRTSTNIEKFGEEYYTRTDEYKERAKNTSLENYGTEHPRKSEQEKEKYRQACIEKHGVDNYFASEEFKKYIKEYWMDLYGVDHFSKTEDSKEKRKEYWKNISPEKLKGIADKTKKTCLDKYGVEYVLQLPETRIPLYDKIGIPTSSYQMKLYEMVKKQYPNAIENHKLKAYVLDIFIFENNIKLAIEYDCWYWHKPEIDDKKNKKLFENNYKVLRIKSGKKLPNESILFKEIEELLYSNKNYSELFLEDWNEEKYRNKEVAL